MRKFIFVIIHFLLLLGNEFGYAASSIETYVYQHLYQGNYQTAITFLHHLEKQGNPEGMHFLGIVYLEGYAGIRDIRLANYYFSRASALGFVPSMKSMADSYIAGDGVQKSEENAYRLYEKAALLGYGPAQFNAGIMLKNGQGVSVSLQKAYQFLNLAAHNPSLGEMREDAAYYRDQ